MIEASEKLENYFENSVSDSLRTLGDKWGNVSLRMIEGDLIFIYKNTSNTGHNDNNTLLGVSVFRNNQYTGPLEISGTYCVELVTTNWSTIYPSVPLTYLQIELLDLLKEFKIDEEVLTTYKQIIGDLKI